VNRAMSTALMGHNYVKSAIDIACWDVFGKAVGRPVVDLLGGRATETMPLYKAVPLAPAAEMVAFVAEQKAHGINRFQLKVGADPYEDAQRVADVAAATEAGDYIIADANCRWGRQDAVIAARLLDRIATGSERVYIEQPCLTLADCLAVRRHSSLPMILDEIITDLRALTEAVAAHGMEAINLKLNRVGGLTQAKLIRDACVEFGLRLTIEDSWGGDLTSAAVSHLGASTPEHALFAVSFMNDWTDNHLCGYQPRSDHGRGAAPSTPGLGVSVNQEKLGAPVGVWS
jgi:cis-L-3-hydroxyproline dehydratase